MTDYSKIHRIGVISDTHNLLRSEALNLLKGVDLILHAGDIGDRNVLAALEHVAPTYVVRGNMDREEWTESLPRTLLVEVGQVTIYMLHDLARLDIVPQKMGVSLVVSGHTHQHREEWRGDVLFLNPGSAGPRRLNKPVSLALVEVEGIELRSEIILLEASV